jgi:predicted alpha/beta superfamily hydrolase
MKFILNQVKPFIDSIYRTLKGPENTAVGGASLGALISFMLGWNYPEVFSMVICMSSALKIDQIDYVKKVNDYQGPLKNLKFYFDVGADSLDLWLKPGTLEMINSLQNKGYKMERDILWFEDAKGFHGEASWAKRVWRPLLFLFGR